MIKSGNRVRMSQKLKDKLKKDCLDGNHRGPMPIRGGSDCDNCSTQHVEEFGDCIGIVQEHVNFRELDWPEVNVLWLPSNLRYCYLPEDLILL